MQLTREPPPLELLTLDHRRSESRWTRRERSTATAARWAKCSASRRSALENRGSRPELVVREDDPDRAVRPDKRNVEPVVAANFRATSCTTSGSSITASTRSLRPRASTRPIFDLVRNHVREAASSAASPAIASTRNPSATGKRDRDDARVDELA